MPPANGEYTMDKVARMRGMDDQGDIPLQLLFNRGQGVLEGLPEHVSHKILSFVPREQTAFDMLFAVPPSINYTIRSMSVTRLSRDNWRGVVDISIKICEIGINERTYMRIKWLVAKGPWPAGTDFVAKKVEMQDVFYSLLDLIEARVDEYGLNGRTRELVLSDVTVKLSYYCFNHVHGWIH